MGLVLALVLALARVGAQEPAPGAEQYYNANALYNKGLHALAIAEYQAFLKTNPQHPKAAEARLGLALSYYASGKLTEAEPLLAQLSQPGQPGNPTQLKLLRAECLNELNRLPEAEKLYTEVTAAPQAQYSAEAWAALTELAFRQKQWAATEERARKLLAAAPAHAAVPAALYQAAYANYELKKPEASQDWLKQLLAQPRPPGLAAQGRLLWGEIHREAGRYREAAEQFAQLVAEAGPAAKPEILFRLGYMRFQAGQFAEATQVLRQLLGTKPEPALAHQAQLMLGRSLLEQGDFHNASQTLRPLAESQAAEAAEALLWYARVSSRQNKFAETAKILAPAAQRFAKSASLPSLLLEQANALVVESQFAAAAKLLEPLLAQRDWPARPTALRLHAVALHRTGDYTASQRSIGLLLATEPATAEIAFISAENLFFLDKNNEALQAFVAFSKQHPQDKNQPAAQYRVALLQHRLGQWQAVLEAAAPLLDQPAAATFGQLDFIVGDSLFRLEKFEAAAQRLAKFVNPPRPAPRNSAPLPNLDTALLELGLAQERLQQPGPAATAYQRLVQEFADSPHRPLALANLGRLRYDAGDYKAARQHLEALVADKRQPPQRLQAAYYLGWIALAEKQPATALTQFGQVANLAQNRDELAADAALQIGLVHLGQEKFAEARTALESLLKQHPQHPRRELAVYSLGLALARLKEWKAASSCFQPLTEQKPPGEFTERALYELAWCAKGLNQSAQAVTWYRRLIAEHGTSELVEKARTELAELTFDAKQFDAVIQELTNTLPGLKDPQLREQALYRLGTAYVGTKEHQQAADTFASFIKEFPGSPLRASANFQAGECLMRLQVTAAARDQFQAAAQNSKDPALRETALLRWGETEGLLSQWKNSQAAYEKLVAEFPKSRWLDRARFGLGWALEKQGQYQRALAEYGRIVAAGKTDEIAARSQFQVGECWFALKEYDKAVTELIRVTTAYRHEDWSAKAILEAGRALEAKGATDKALAQYREVLQKFPRHDAATVARQRIGELRREQ